MGGWEEVQEERDIHMFMADSYSCMAENNITL